MKRLVTVSTVPMLAMMAACGSGDRGRAGDIVTTNAGDVVLNDAQANYTFRGDNETAANDAVPADGAMTDTGTNTGAAGKIGRAHV